MRRRRAGPRACDTRMHGSMCAARLRLCRALKTARVSSAAPRPPFALRAPADTPTRIRRMRPSLLSAPLVEGAELRRWLVAAGLDGDVLARVESTLEAEDVHTVDSGYPGGFPRQASDPRTWAEPVPDVSLARVAGFQEY